MLGHNMLAGNNRNAGTDEGKGHRNEHAVHESDHYVRPLLLNDSP